MKIIPIYHPLINQNVEHKKVTLSNNLYYANNISTPLFCGKEKLANNYDEWFKSYLNSTNEKELIATEIANTIKNTELHDNFKNKNKIKILDIGCGNGVLTEKYLKQLSDIFPNKKIEVDAMDVNSKLLKDFKQNHLINNKNITINILEKDFFKEPTPKHHYDLAIASHVMYYSDNLERDLQKIQTSLSDSGNAFIFHHSGKDCVLSNLRAKYNPTSSANINQTKEEISQNDIIKNSLDNLEIKYETKKQYFNLSIPQNINTPIGRNLISFIVDKPFLELAQENKVCSFLEDLNKLKDTNNSLNLHNNMYIIENNAINNISQDLQKYKGNIDIVFADIDGTLSLSDDIVTDTNINAGNVLHDNKIPLILTTARTYKDTLPILNNFQNKPEYVITLQGGSIYDNEGNVFVKNPISQKDGINLLNWHKENFLHDKNSHLIMYFNDDPYSESDIQFLWKCRKPITKINSLQDMIYNFELQKAMLYKTNAIDSDTNNIMLSFNNAKNKNLQIYESGTGFYEIQNADVSKDKAISLILNKLNIEPQRSMAIGDSSNDIEMLDFVKNNNGLAVAMGNAKSIVKEHSNAVTTNVEDNGFALVIKNII